MKQFLKNITDWLSNFAELFFSSPTYPFPYDTKDIEDFWYDNEPTYTVKTVTTTYKNHNNLRDPARRWKR